MKTIEEIIKQTPVFLGLWNDSEDVFRDFEEEPSDKIHILFASYDADGYCGDAFVLYEDGGELFEVNGGHCSCYGLEGQWNPESVVLNELIGRASRMETYGKELIFFLKD